MSNYNKIEFPEYNRRIQEKYNGEYDVLEFNGLGNDAKFRHNKCGYIYFGASTSFMNGKGGCPVCVKGTTQNTESFIRRMSNMYGEEFTADGEYVSNTKKIPIIHNKCGYRFERSPNAILGGKCSCPNCSDNNGGVLIEFLNDIFTSAPEMIPLLKDKDDAHRFSPNSSQKTWFTCPYCKNDFYKKIINVHRNGLCCGMCSDKISYAEKFMHALLNQLGIDFKPQYSPKWADKFRYDFMFEYKNVKYIIELDGQFHYRSVSFSNAANVKENDREKDFLAKENGFKMIRIDCNYDKIEKRFDYIVNSILNSELSDVFNFDDVDFKYCANISNIPFVKMIGDDWNNGVKSYFDFYDKYHLKRSTIRKYLKQASDAGMIKESYENILASIRKASNKMLSKSKGTKVLCEQTGEIFDTYGEANKKYGCGLSSYFSKNYKYSGSLPDGTKLSWKKIS